MSRFAQPDPYDGSYRLEDPQSFNRYSYVNNVPVSFTDPSGLLLAAPGCGSWMPDPNGGLVWVACPTGSVTIFSGSDPASSLFGGSIFGRVIEAGGGLVDIGGFYLGGIFGGAGVAPTPTEPPNPGDKSVDECIQQAARTFFSNQAQAAVVGYASWTGMDMLTLALVSTRGQVTLAELYHVTEGRSRIAAGYAVFAGGMIYSGKKHVSNYREYQAALKNCRSG